MVLKWVQTTDSPNVIEPKTPKLVLIFVVPKVQNGRVYTLYP
jgi:hypothetical protein